MFFLPGYFDSIRSVARFTEKAKKKATKAPFLKEGLPAFMALIILT